MQDIGFSFGIQHEFVEQEEHSRPRSVDVELKKRLNRVLKSYQKRENYSWANLIVAFKCWNEFKTIIISKIWKKACHKKKFTCNRKQKRLFWHGDQTKHRAIFEGANAHLESKFTTWYVKRPQNWWKTNEFGPHILWIMKNIFYIKIHQ